MKRKVVQHGTNTFTISLPMDWVKRNKIHIGDELEVIDKLTTLEVCKEKEEENKEITLEIKEINTYLFKRYLGNLYRKGYDSIIFRFPDEKIKNSALELIISFLENCIGFELISQDKNIIHIKSIARLKEGEFSNALRRYFFLSLQVVETFYELIENGNSSLVAKVIDLEKKQTTLYLYCTRVLNKMQILAKDDLLLHYLLIERLEEVCDEYRDMALYIQKMLYAQEGKSFQFSKEFIMLTKQSCDYFRSLYDLYYSYNNAKIGEITAKRERFVELQRNIFEDKNIKEIPLFHHLCTALIKMYEASSPIVGFWIGK